MADQNVNELTAATTYAGADKLYLGISPFGSTNDRGITITNFFGNVPVDVMLETGKAIQTDTAAGNTLLLQVYDVDGAAYETFGTLTANNSPTWVQKFTRAGIGGAADGTIPLTVTVSGSATGWRVTDGTVNVEAYISAGSTGWLGTQSNHDLYLYTNDTQRITINANGLDLTQVSGKITNGATELARFDNGGDFLLGTTTKPTANGGKVMTFGDNTADPTMGTNTAGIYAKDVAGTVEMFAVDEGDVASQISPHDSEGYWWQNSYFFKAGVNKRIHVERFMEAAISALGLTLSDFIESVSFTPTDKGPNPLDIKPAPKKILR